MVKRYWALWDDLGVIGDEEIPAVWVDKTTAVVLLADYDWLKLDRDSHQRVAMRAMERADKAETRAEYAEARAAVVEVKLQKARELLEKYGYRGWSKAKNLWLDSTIDAAGEQR